MLKATKGKRRTMSLAVRKQLLYELIDWLDEMDHQTAYDF